MARLLAPTDFGLVAIAMVYIAFADLVAEQGLGSALIQRRNLEDAHKSTALVCSLALGLILTGITWAIAPFIADTVGDPRAAPIIQALSVRILLLPLTSIQQALLRKALDYRSLSIRSIVSQIVGGLLGVVLAFKGLGAWSLVGQQLASATASTLLLWWIGPWKPNLRFSLAHLKELYSFSIWVQIRNVFLYLSKNVDTVIIALLFGTVTLGIYTVAYRLVQQILGAVTGIFGSVSFPYLSQVSNDLREVRRRYSTILGITSALAFPVFFTLVVCAEQVFHVVFGSKWAASIPVFQCMCITGMILSVSYLFNGLSLALGHPRLPVGLLILRTGLVVAGISTTAHEGLIAITLAIASVLFISLLIEFVAIRSIAGLPIFSILRILLPPLVAAALGASAAYSATSGVGEFHPLVLMISKTIILMVVYVALFRILSKKTFSCYFHYISKKLIYFKSILVVRKPRC
jgi:O-antigen/teichoic acid export membrane protein